jgi:hypothetical protein
VLYETVASSSCASSELQSDTPMFIQPFSVLTQSKRHVSAKHGRAGFGGMKYFVNIKIFLKNRIRYPSIL